MSQKKTSLKNLDINNIGAWPQNAKIGFCVILALFILAYSYFLFDRFSFWNERNEYFQHSGKFFPSYVDFYLDKWNGK